MSTLFPMPLPGQNNQFQFVDRKNEKLTEFFSAMAVQFKAGLVLAKENGGDNAANAVGRDIDSFIVEADKHFPDKFNREQFIKIAFSTETAF